MQSPQTIRLPPSGIRCSVIALGFNLSFGLLGGLSPLAATWLVHRTQLDLTPAYMIVAAAALSLAALRTFERKAPAALVAS